MNATEERIIDRYEDERPMGVVGYYDHALGRFVVAGRLMGRTVKLADRQGRVRLACGMYPEEPKSETGPELI